MALPLRQIVMIVLILVGALFSAAIPVRADEILIGEYASMTGGTATFGVSSDEGARLALDEINAAGGVLGKQLKLVLEDDQSKSDVAVTAVKKLITLDHVVAIIGEVASSRSLAAAPICQNAHVPMVSPASTNPKVTQTGDYVFRTCFIDPFQGKAMADFAMQELKFKKFAILYDVKNDYSKGLRDFFAETVKKNGGEIVADESYAEGDIDFKPTLTKIKNIKPDAIYVPGYYNDVAQICREARELGITVPLMGGDGWDSEKLVEIGRDAVNGCYFTNHYSPDEKRPEVQKFMDAYKQKYGGKTPDAMAILGYDAMKLLADAIQRAGSTKPKAIREALAATKNFIGASGTITIDADRNAQKSAVVLKYENGKTAYIATVAPDGKVTSNK